MLGLVSFLGFLGLEWSSESERQGDSKARKTGMGATVSSSDYRSGSIQPLSLSDPLPFISSFVPIVPSVIVYRAAGSMGPGSSAGAAWAIAGSALGYVFHWLTASPLLQGPVAEGEVGTQCVAEIAGLRRAGYCCALGLLLLAAAVLGWTRWAPPGLSAAPASVHVEARAVSVTAEARRPRPSPQDSAWVRQPNVDDDEDASLWQHRPVRRTAEHHYIGH